MGRNGSKEFMWRASKEDASTDDLLTHLVYDHYSSRADSEGFDWERKSKPITAANVAARAASFAGAHSPADVRNAFSSPCVISNDAFAAFALSDEGATVLVGR